MTKKSKKAEPLARASYDADAPIARPYKFTPEVERALLFAAERGWPKNLAAPYAGIAESTLHQWLTDEREPLVSFACEFQKLFAKAGGDLVDAVKLSDPKYLLGAVFQIKATEKHEVTGKDGKSLIPEPTGRLLTDDELIAKAQRLLGGDE